MSDLPHTAISSCSGYIYQGKIAVMHCLRLFEEMGEDARHLLLEIESLDDFAILNSDKSYRSMHQVKAKKSPDFSQYKSAINKQIDDSKAHIGIDTYFHTATLIKGEPDNFSLNFTPVQFYIYRDEAGKETKACALDKVDLLNEVQVKKTYQALGQKKYKFENNDYLEKTRQCLEDLVVKHIIEVHHKIIIERKNSRTDRRIAMESKIPLESFYQLLVNKNMNEVCDGENYFHYLLLKDAGYYFHEYCFSQVEENSEVLLKLNLYLSKINSFDIPQLIKFVQSIFPHRKAEFKTILQYKDNAFTRDDFRYGLLPIFHELIKSKARTDLFFYWEKDEAIYVPTAISISARHVGGLCVEIVQAALDHDVHLFYESEKLINQSIDSESIFSNIPMGKLWEPEEPNEKRSKRIDSFKNISLVSLDKAKRLINE
jgi:hypothetical protein